MEKSLWCGVSAPRTLRGLMTRRRHSNVPHGLFFVTTSTIDHLIHFNGPLDYQLIMEKIEYYRIRDKAEIHAYVIMPTHFHLLISILEGRSISDYMRDLKKRIAFEYFSLYKLPAGKFWQDGFDCFDINSQDTYATKLKYTHYNPVRKGLVEKPEDWKYSSARFYLTGTQGIIQVTPLAA